MIANPVPGDPADGLRVISAKFTGKTYSVDLEGPAGTTGDFRLRMLNHTRISKLVNSDIFQLNEDTFLLRVNFKDNGQPYVRRTVMMETVR